MPNAPDQSREGQQSFVRTILKDGNKRANVVAEATLDEVRNAMKTIY